MTAQLCALVLTGLVILAGLNDPALTVPAATAALGAYAGGHVGYRSAVRRNGWDMRRTGRHRLISGRW